MGAARGRSSTSAPTREALGESEKGATYFDMKEKLVTVGELANKRATPVAHRAFQLLEQFAQLTFTRHHQPFNEKEPRKP